MILCVSMTSCATNRPPTLIEGKDGGDIGKIKEPPVNWEEWSKGKMWMTYEYARRYYHWKNNK